MSRKKAFIKVRNNTNQRVLVQLYHTNPADGLQSMGMIIEANSVSTDTLTVYFHTGFGHLSDPDFWFAVLHVVDGDSEGTYISGTIKSTIESPNWKECQLQTGDANKNLVFDINTSKFKINLSSDECSTQMRKARDFQPVQHVFMLMLENHSFDNIMAFSGVQGITRATTNDSNSYNGTSYNVHKPAPKSMDTDPGHEFSHVVTQLCGASAKYVRGKPYPPINNSGFATSYAGLSPNSKTNLDYDIYNDCGDGTTHCMTSPSIAAMPDGSFRMAFQAHRPDLEYGKLNIIGPDYSNLSTYGSTRGCNPSIIVTADKKWHLAFCAAGTKNLWVSIQGTAGGDTKLQMHGNPSLVIMSDGSLRTAFKADDKTLQVWSSRSPSNPTKTSCKMAAASSPSMIASGKNWITAFLDDSDRFCIYNGASSKSIPYDILVKKQTNPTLAAMPGGKWVAAIQAENGHLFIINSDSPNTPLDTHLPMAPNTSPSIAATSDGQVYVAFQNNKNYLSVFNKNSQSVAYIGPKMMPDSSPSIALMTTGGYQVAFQSDLGKPSILDQNGNPPQPDNIKNIMACFDTPKQLPVTQYLAKNFQACDHWFSSLPGPTWPNRFFAHCASSGGMDASPGLIAMGTAFTVDGYSMPNGTIFKKIKRKSWPGTQERMIYQLYQDCQTSAFAIESAAAIKVPIPANSLYSENPYSSYGVFGLGWMPMVIALDGMHSKDLRRMSRYKRDIMKPYDAAYTVIEPHYGNVVSETYKGGSSQHPMDGTYGGEGLIKAVYEGLRNSPLWYTSILIVTYDEHGGFYDSVKPPAAVSPNDGGTTGNVNGFDFKQYGARVPAFVISPLVNAGVSNAIYDHASIPKTIEECFNLTSLTERDKNANSVSQLCTLSIKNNTIRKNCPTTLPDPVKTSEIQMQIAELVDIPSLDEMGPILDEPLPESGNFIGMLQILLKTELELCDGAPDTRNKIIADFRNIKTRRDAANYGKKIWEKLEEMQKTSQSDSNVVKKEKGE